jgi:hypothetical protein
VCRTPRYENCAHLDGDVGSVARVTLTYDVPPGWTSSDSSRKPLRLINTYAFSKSAAPPLDQWTHFAMLRPVSWNLTGWCAGIVVFMGWGLTGMITQGLLEEAWPFAVVIAGFLLFFGFHLAKALLGRTTRTTWPHIHGIGLGESGIIYRLPSGDADIPWESVRSINATITNADNANPRKGRHPVLRVTYNSVTDDGAPVHLERELAIDILGSSPLVVYWTFLYYWATPENRHELGTTVGQKRMDTWLAQLTKAPAAV